MPKFLSFAGCRANCGEARWFAGVPFRIPRRSEGAFDPGRYVFFTPLVTSGISGLGAFSVEIES
jgi:hypothetical protein